MVYNSMSMMEIIVYLAIVVIALVLIDSFQNRKAKELKKRKLLENEKQYSANKEITTIIQNNSNTIEQKHDYEEKIAERIAKREKDSIEFRKLYDLPEAATLNYDFYERIRHLSSTKMKVTSHEYEIARQIILNNYFDRRCVFLDSYFKTKSGRYVQIDIIAINKKGVFVFESKDYSGWIFGNGNQQMWTQSFYKEKYRFYNPVRQNYGHIQCLKEVAKKNGINYYSVIVFGDKAVLKNISYVPKDTFVATTNKVEKMMSDIMQNREDCLSANEIIAICRLISKNKIEPTDDTRNNHIEKIKDTTGENRIYE